MHVVRNYDILVCVYVYTEVVCLFQQGRIPGTGRLFINTVHRV